MVIPVDPIYGRKAASSYGHGLRRSLEHLAAEGLLVVFPAGTVSHFRWKDRAISDPEWNPAVARMIGIAARKGCRVSVVPAYVEGRNGLSFQLVGIAHPAFRTALLGRELLNKRGHRVEVRIGAPVTPDKLLAIPTAREQVDYLRWRTYLLSSRQNFKPRTALPGPNNAARTNGIAETIAVPADADEVAAEIAALPGKCLLNRSGDLEVYLSRALHIPKVLWEIGRLREATFRAVGEGTGKPLDLDEFDSHYLHLFVWNARRQELVGAYRLARTDVVRRHFGVPGLYTATLFRYADPFLDRMGPALELGRSFVRQEYQKGFRTAAAFVEGHRRVCRQEPAIQDPVWSRQHQQPVRGSIARADGVIPGKVRDAAGLGRADP